MKTNIWVVLLLLEVCLRTASSESWAGGRRLNHAIEVEKKILCPLHSFKKTSSLVDLRAFDKKRLAINPSLRLMASQFSSHHKGKRESLVRDELILLVTNDEMRLIKQGILLKQWNIPMEQYHSHKYMAHASEEILLRMVEMIHRNLSADDREELVESKCLTEQSLLEIQKLPGEEVVDTFILMNARLELINSSIELGVITSEALKKYRNAVTDLEFRHIEQAAKYQHDMLCMYWQRVQLELGEKGADRLLISVLGSSQAKEGNVHVQFFREHHHPDRVFYVSDEYHDLPKISDLTAIQYIDRKLALLRFEAQDALERDLLGEAFEQILR